jgi:adenylosuccinate lyase
VLVEGMVAGHERDGRAWKAEWLALPEVCQLTGAALRLAGSLLAGLQVHPDAMAATVRRYGPDLGSERVLAELAGRVGKHRAQQVLHEVLRDDGGELAAGLSRRGLADAEEVRRWRDSPSIEAAAAMVDTVCARAASARAGESERWA